jgi:hypothetical protein
MNYKYTPIALYNLYTPYHAYIQYIQTYYLVV